MSSRFSYFLWSRVCAPVNSPRSEKNKNTARTHTHKDNIHGVSWLRNTNPKHATETYPPYQKSRPLSVRETHVTESPALSLANNVHFGASLSRRSVLRWERPGARLSMQSADTIDTSSGRPSRHPGSLTLVPPLVLPVLPPVLPPTPPMKRASSSSCLLGSRLCSSSMAPGDIRGHSQHEWRIQRDPSNLSLCEPI